MTYYPDPLTADEWHAYRRSMRYLAYVKRMRQPAKEADPRAWLEAMERGDLGDPDEDALAEAVTT